MNVSSAYIHSNLTTQTTSRNSEQTEVQKSGGDNDGDSDDGAKSTVTSIPTVNSNGNTLGQLINVSA